MTDAPTEFTIGKYTVTYRNTGWTVLREKDLVGYYATLEDAMAALLRERLTRLGKGTAKEILARVRASTEALREEWK